MSDPNLDPITIFTYIEFLERLAADEPTIPSNVVKANLKHIRQHAEQLSDDESWSKV